MSTTTLVIEGQRYSATAEWGILDDAPSTQLTVIEETTGNFVGGHSYSGWLSQERAVISAEFILLGTPPEPLRTDDPEWVTVRLRIRDGGEVDAAPSAPTRSGRTEVRYDHDADGRLPSLRVRAQCTEAQEDAIMELLLAYDRARREHGGDLIGGDRFCLHDSAFEPSHDPHCALVALDALAVVLAIEVDVLLAR